MTPEDSEQVVVTLGRPIHLTHLQPRSETLTLQFTEVGSSALRVDHRDVADISYLISPSIYSPPPQKKKTKETNAYFINLQALIIHTKNLPKPLTGLIIGFYGKPWKGEVSTHSFSKSA